MSGAGLAYLSANYRETLKRDNVSTYGSCDKMKTRSENEGPERVSSPIRESED